MKKIICVLLLAFTSVMTVTSCTEEEVNPKIETDNNGGLESDIIKKG